MHFFKFVQPWLRDSNPQGLETWSMCFLTIPLSMRCDTQELQSFEDTSVLCGNRLQYVSMTGEGFENVVQLLSTVACTSWKTATSEVRAKI